MCPSETQLWSILGVTLLRRPGSRFANRQSGTPSLSPIGTVKEHLSSYTRGYYLLRCRNIYQINQFLDEEEIEKLSGREKYHIGGNKEGTKKHWDSMKEGDYVFFYKNGFFFKVGKLYHKKHNKAFADFLFNPGKDGKSWEYTFFVEED